MVSRRAFAQAMRRLLDNNFKFTVIGGTIAALAMGQQDLGDDVDVFAESPSIVDNEDAFRSVAEANSWDYGQTWLGTPRITIIVSDEEVPVEFYDNLYDFYIPERFLAEAKRVEVEGVRVKALGLEHYLVLKARSGSDDETLKYLGEAARKGRLKVEANRIYDLSKEFDDRQVIIRKLKEYGII